MLSQKHSMLLKAAMAFCAFAGVAAVGSESASAQTAPVPFPATPVQLSQLLPGGQYAGGLIIGDKVFADFSYLGSGTPTNPAPTATQIWVGNDQYVGPNTEGLTFSAPWESINGLNESSLIGYAVRTLSGAPLIHSVGLSFDGAVMGTPGTATASVTETAFQATYNPSSNTYTQGAGLSGTVANQANGPSFSVFNNGTTDVADNRLTLSSDQSAIIVYKNIQLNTLTGSPDMATVSMVTNTFQQSVPEPASAALLALGTVGMLARRRKV